MIIDSLNAAWWLMLAVQIALILVIWLVGRKKSERAKERLIIGVWVFMVLYLIAYKYYLIALSTAYETSFWNELPLNLCQVASLMVLPAIVSRNRTLKGFSAFVGTCCSMMGMLMPVAGFYNIPLLSGESIGFYGFHGLVFVICVSLFTLGLYRPQVKDVPKIMLLLAFTALVVHGINWLLRATVFPGANYFFTYDTEGNPILDIFRNLIDVPYVYQLPLMIPVGIVLALVSLLFKKKDKN